MRMSFVIKAGDGGPGQFILGDAHGDAGETPKAPRLLPPFRLDARRERRRNVSQHAITQAEFIWESAAAGLNMSYMSRCRFFAAVFFLSLFFFSAVNRRKHSQTRVFAGSAAASLNISSEVTRQQILFVKPPNTLTACSPLPPPPPSLPPLALSALPACVALGWA